MFGMATFFKVSAKVLTLVSPLVPGATRVAGELLNAVNKLIIPTDKMLLDLLKFWNKPVQSAAVHKAIYGPGVSGVMTPAILYTAGLYAVVAVASALLIPLLVCIADDDLRSENSRLRKLGNILIRFLKSQFFADVVTGAIVVLILSIL